MQADIRIQQEDFSIARETAALRQPGCGAVVTFSGLVRELDNAQDAVDSGTQTPRVRGLFLEHYPGMTEKSLQAIADDAASRWPLLGLTIIHRIGKLMASEQIVFVGVSSAHRGAAFAACEFIMDYLKTRAPFWKKSLQEDGEFWVEAKDSDTDASKRW